jgi:hypothetical protein
MAILEYSAECLCGGKIITTFKKPTRFQHSISRTHCQGCGSEFMFTFTIEYKDGVRAYVPDHEVVQMTGKLKEKLKEMETKEVSA